MLLSCFPLPAFLGDDDDDAVEEEEAIVIAVVAALPSSSSGAFVGRAGSIVFPPGCFLFPIAAAIMAAAVFPLPCCGCLLCGCCRILASLFPGSFCVPLAGAVEEVAARAAFSSSSSSPLSCIENQSGPKRKDANPSHPRSCDVPILPPSFVLSSSLGDDCRCCRCWPICISDDGSDDDGLRPSCIAAGAVQSAMALRASYALEWAEERPDASTFEDTVSPTVSMYPNSTLPNTSSASPSIPSIPRCNAARAADRLAISAQYAASSSAGDIIPPDNNDAVLLRRYGSSCDPSCDCDG
mmetsp:Transcript_37942/g.91537  ORF Transcript_37942/g.91537 Transcript_37942/m.91537 type:complete len:297 (+) Transcript_37942:927-1817(+)